MMSLALLLVALAAPAWNVAPCEWTETLLVCAGGAGRVEDGTCLPLPADAVEPSDGWLRRPADPPPVDFYAGPIRWVPLAEWLLLGHHGALWHCLRDEGEPQ